MSMPRPNEHYMARLRDRALSPEQLNQMRKLQTSLGIHVPPPAGALEAMRKVHERAVERAKDDALIKAREAVVAKMSREERMLLAIFGWKEGEAEPYPVDVEPLFGQVSTGQNPFNTTKEN